MLQTCAAWGSSQKSYFAPIRIQTCRIFCSYLCMFVSRMFVNRGVSMTQLFKKQNNYELILFNWRATPFRHLNYRLKTKSALERKSLASRKSPLNKQCISRFISNQLRRYLSKNSIEAKTQILQTYLWMKQFHVSF